MQTLTLLAFETEGERTKTQQNTEQHRAHVRLIRRNDHEYFNNTYAHQHKQHTAQ